MTKILNEDACFKEFANDFAWLTDANAVLDNLLSSEEYGIDYAYVLSEANVKEERRAGGTVCYLPLYMLPFVAEEARGKRLTVRNDEDVDWKNLLLQ